MSEWRFGKGWLKPIAGNSCRTRSLPKPTSATTDEDTLYARCLLRPRANNPIPERAICGRCAERSGKHSRGGCPLKDHPHSGYRTDDPDVRVIFVVRYPYKIFYRVRDAIEI